MAAKLPPKAGAYSRTYTTCYRSNEEARRGWPVAVEEAMKDRDPRVVTLARQLKEKLARQSRNAAERAASADR